jgi:hypothetical protein
MTFKPYLLPMPRHFKSKQERRFENIKMSIKVPSSLKIIACGGSKLNNITHRKKQL